MSNAERLIYAYRAAHVQRWHVRGYMLRKDYVGRHSHGVATIIAILHPDPSAQLLKAALFHDLGEFEAGGDIEHRPGMGSAEAHALMDSLEFDARKKYGLQSLLGEQDLVWLNAADSLDGWMVIYENIICGNSMLAKSYSALTEKIIEKCNQNRQFGGWPKVIMDTMMAMQGFDLWSEK